MVNRKETVALWSILAAIFLTTTKLTVGILTNSLGILAEAMHSALDLVAAAITFMAVHYSGRPADEDHPFGHGKIENFSALIETLILVITCGWVISEAFSRFVNPAPVEVNILSFSVILLAIFIDWERSRMLFKVAKETNSQALQADALHFSTDILSSSVVIVGLIAVLVKFPMGDTIAACGVAIIVTWISLRLGKKTIDALMDISSEKDKVLMEHMLKYEFPQLIISKIRLRESGPFVVGDVLLEISSDITLEQSHSLTQSIEKRIKAIFPNSNVLIVLQPHNSSSHYSNNSLQQNPSMWYQALRTISIPTSIPYEVHDISISKVSNDYLISLHFQVPSTLNVKEAHELAERYKEEVKSNTQEIKHFNVHIEPFEEIRSSSKMDDISLELFVKNTLNKYPEVKELRKIKIFRNEDTAEIHLTIAMDPLLNIAECHQMIDKIEKRLQTVATRTSIHVEPLN